MDIQDDEQEEHSMNSTADLSSQSQHLSKVIPRIHAPGVWGALGLSGSLGVSVEVCKDEFQENRR
jgi:hypothetical protein